MTSPLKCTRVKPVKGYIAALYGSRTRPLVDSLLNTAGCVSVIDLICLNSKTPLSSIYDMRVRYTCFGFQELINTVNIYHVEGAI